MVIGLADKLQVTIIAGFAQLTILHSFQQCATIFRRVSTIGKPAARGHLRDIDETLVNPAAHANRSEFTHSGSVNQHGPLFKDDQLAPRGRVPALSVIIPDSLCVEQRLTDQLVDCRGLSHTG